MLLFENFLSIWGADRTLGYTLGTLQGRDHTIYISGYQGQESILKGHQLLT
jgi:hypothetical protein